MVVCAGRSGNVSGAGTPTDGETMSRVTVVASELLAMIIGRRTRAGGCSPKDPVSIQSNCEFTGWRR